MDESVERKEKKEEMLMGREMKEIHESEILKSLRVHIQKYYCYHYYSYPPTSIITHSTIILQLQLK